MREGLQAVAPAIGCCAVTPHRFRGELQFLHLVSSQKLKLQKWKLKCGSNCLLNFGHFPSRFVAQHGIDSDQQDTHAGHESHFGALAALSQVLVACCRALKIDHFLRVVRAEN